MSGYNTMTLGIWYEFINAIRGAGKIIHTTFEDGVRYMEFTEAVVKKYSIEKRNSIAIVKRHLKLI